MKYHFQGQYAISKRWFDLDHEWLEENIFTRAPDFYSQLYKMNIEIQDMETYQIFVVTMGNTKTIEEL